MRIVMAALFVAMLSGCVESDGAGLLADVPQTKAEVMGSQVTVFTAPTILISDSLDGPWNHSAEYLYDFGVSNVPEGPGTLPTQTGSILDVEYQLAKTIYLRLPEDAGLRGLEATWMRLTDDEAEILGTVPGNETFAYRVDSVGNHKFVALLMRGSEMVAATGVEANVTLDAKFRFHGAAWPVNPQGALPLSDSERDAMADQIRFFAPAGGQLVTSTGFDGTYTPSDGTDVDLEHLGPSGHIAYVGAGGTGSPTPIPEQAHEELTSPIAASGQYTVRVGYVSTACAGCYYHNVGNVPYYVDILLDY